MSFIKDIPSLMDKVCCSMWVEQLDEVWPRMVRHCRWVCCFVDDFMWVFKDYLLHLSSLHLFLCSISGPIKLKYLTQKLPSQNISKTWDHSLIWHDFFDVGKSSSNGRPSSNATKISKRIFASPDGLSTEALTMERYADPRQTHQVWH